MTDRPRLRMPPFTREQIQVLRDAIYQAYRTGRLQIAADLEDLLVMVTPPREREKENKP